MQLRVLVLCLTSHRSGHSDQSDHSDHLHAGSLTSVKSTRKICVNWLSSVQRRRNNVISGEIGATVGLHANLLCLVA